MRLSKIQFDGTWYTITLSEGDKVDVIFTGNLQYAMDLANEWENYVE